jgi:hypothetical protein
MCEVEWDLDKADQMQELIETSTGQRCPCYRGERCPLVPDDVAARMRIPAPAPTDLVNCGP